MATQLLKLRNVPEDELQELYALLDDNDISYYETSGGNWGMSMPALWLSNDEQASLAKGLLEAYSEQRQLRVRTEYAELKAAGKARSFLDIAKENPLKFILYLLGVGVLVYLSLMPFIALGS